MAFASIEVSGQGAEVWGRDLRGVLASTGEQVAPVEVERSPELVIAVIALVFSGVDTAKTIWDWWGARRAQGDAPGMTVTVLLGDGVRVDLSALDQPALEAELRRRLDAGE